jgi:hypothetical protein
MRTLRIHARAVGFYRRHDLTICGTTGEDEACIGLGATCRSPNCTNIRRQTCAQNITVSYESHVNPRVSHTSEIHGQNRR